MGRAPNSDDNNFLPKTKTKQEIKLKTNSSDRILDIPDFVFEAILESRNYYWRVTELKDYLDDVLPKETDKFIKEGNILDLSDFDVRKAFENLM